RLEDFSLSLHPDKTRLIEFGRHAAARRAQRGLGKPETFKFLGFVFICGHTRKGKFQLRRKSRRDRMRAKLSQVKENLRRRMHQPKGGGQGERGRAKHAPDPGSGARVTGARSRTESCKAEEGREVHRAPTPH